MQESALSRLTLGLDIGSASIGWALIDPDGQQVVAAGVRIFDAGVDAAAFEKGQRGASNNTVRRQKRLQRRQFRRRAGRQRELFLALQAAGLLPNSAETSGRAGGSEERHATLTALDTKLREEFGPLMQGVVPAPEQVLPYFLRARALDHALSPHALGRALYHLGQRRGFQSNRRAAANEAEERKQAETDAKSSVKGDIASLAGAIEGAGTRTLGEFLARQDPESSRLRARWTGRAMFIHEFDLIWQTQAAHHAVLTPELRERIHRLLFFQRPIRGGKVGMCELETDCQRAPMASLTAQHFRLLQKVNDLRILDPYLKERPLSEAERSALAATLEREGDLTFASIKKRELVRLHRGERFNLESGGEKKLPGNRTASKLRLVFGARWEEFSERERDRVVGAWVGVESADQLVRLGQEEYGLARESAEKWAGQDCQPEEGYAKLSLKAMRRLLPLMVQGAAFKSAEAQVYGSTFSGGQPMDQLRPVGDALPQIPNPAVQRSLTELRKLVNAIVKEYGKPWEIRIELARDLKRNAAQRASLSKRMRDRGAERKRLEQRLKSELGLPRPSGRDIEAASLYEQAQGICPYCGQMVAFGEMFNSGLGQLDHILPRSRFPDDSPANKCIAHVACNREKADRIPEEAFGHDPERWAQILERVRKWDDDGKLRAFQVTAADFDLESDSSFASRRLNETRYATTMAAKYLGLLYGGRDVDRGDGSRRRVIFASSGVVTATLRRAWLLEAILRQPEASANGLNPGKPRHDHRHHAVDAIVVALTSNATIQQLSLANAAAAAVSGGERTSSRALPAPWPDFVDRVRPKIISMVVSHRPDHKLAGQLHEETNYSKPHRHNGREYIHVRKPLQKLTASQAGDIVDPTIAKLVAAKLSEVGDPKKIGDLFLQTPAGRQIPVRKVRIRAEAKASASSLGQGQAERWVLERASHHICLFAGRDRLGRDVWDGTVVSRLEAQRRSSRHEAIVRKTFDEAGFEFLFSLMGGDTVEMGWEPGRRDVAVVRTISQSPATGVIELAFVRHTQAAKIADIKMEEKQTGRKEWLRITRLTELQDRACRKVVVDLLGRVREAKD